MWARTPSFVRRCLGRWRTSGALAPTLVTYDSLPCFLCNFHHLVTFACYNLGDEFRRPRHAHPLGPASGLGDQPRGAGHADVAGEPFPAPDPAGRHFFRPQLWPPDQAALEVPRLHPEALEPQAWD